MDLILVTGGVRGGKSRYAQRRASELGGDEVTVIATAQPVDEEMARRIDNHRRERPVAWTTIEAPLRLDAALSKAKSTVVLIDCVTVLVSNALGAVKPADETAALAATAREIDMLLDAARDRPGVLIVVTNEVGFSVHPPTALGRWFCDCLGWANQRLANEASEVVLMVSGIDVSLKHE